MGNGWRLHTHTLCLDVYYNLRVAFEATHAKGFLCKDIFYYMHTLVISFPYT